MDLDPFGQRRKLDDFTWLASGAFEAKATSRGFTGHDQLDGVNLLHMKGRVYDPQIGLFLTPDPYIQDPSLVQNLNRYSYVINNPLRYNDPSGHFFKDIFRGITKGLSSGARALSNPWRFLQNTWDKAGRAISDPRYHRLAASIVISVVGTVNCPFGAQAAWYQSAAYFAAVGASSSYVATNGDQKAALNGAVTGAAFNMIGSYFHSLGGGKALSNSMMVAKVAAHGAVGGLSSVSQGGSFVSGFMATGLSQAASVWGVYDSLGAVETAQGWQVGYNAAVAAVVGGTISSSTGGSFESGALNAAMGRLFNDLSHVVKLSPLMGGLSALDGPLPLGDVAAAGVGAAALVYGDDAVRWVEGKFRLLNADSGLPANPDDLLVEGYEETSHPEAKKFGSREFTNSGTGDKVRFDKGNPQKNGHGSRDHYHRYNPNATSKYDAYLDSSGRPVRKGSDPSHLYPSR